MFWLYDDDEVDEQLVVLVVLDEEDEVELEKYKILNYRLVMIFMRLEQVSEVVEHMLYIAIIMMLDFQVFEIQLRFDDEDEDFDDMQTVVIDRIDEIDDELDEYDVVFVKDLDYENIVEVLM